MKKMTSFVLAVLMVAVLILPVSAAAITPGETVSPCWNNISSVTVEVSFPSGTGCATVDVTRVYGVTTSIAGTLTVYKQVGNQWVYVDTVSGVSTYSLRLELYFDATSGTTYKALAEATAYSSTEAESISLYDIETCP